MKELMYPYRLGIYHSAIRKEGERIFTIPPFARYLDHSAGMFKELVVIGPVLGDTRVDLCCEVKARNVRSICLPSFSTTIESLGSKKEIMEVLKGSVDEFDLLWMRYPTQYGEHIYRESLKRGKKAFIQVVGDPVEAVSGTDKYKGFFRAVALAYALYRERTFKRICETATVFTNGSVLYDKFSRRGRLKNVTRVVSSALLEQDYFERADTCCGDRVRILYVGYLQRRKGVRFLLDAFASLLDMFGDIELTIVGDGEDRGAISDRVRSLGIEDKVVMKGWVPMGDELNLIHRRSDIFVFPTLAGEGTPRAILHAMANSLPVVATNVNGIPDVIDNGRNGLLVEPYSSDAIVAEVTRVIKDARMRVSLIRNGFETASRMSMNAFLNSMFDKVVVS